MMKGVNWRGKQIKRIPEAAVATDVSTLTKVVRQLKDTASAVTPGPAVLDESSSFIAVNLTIIIK